VWKVIKTKVQRRIDDIRNAEDLKTVVAEIWTSLQLHYIRSLYDSLPRRLRVVLRARGNITKYKQFEVSFIIYFSKKNYNFSLLGTQTLK
jgi:RNase P/RNase MRP subunit p30